MNTDAPHLVQASMPTFSKLGTLDEIVAILVLAFAADPVARWMCGGTLSAHLNKFSKLMRVLSQDCVDAGTAGQSDKGGGVALWLPPGAPTDDDEMARVFPLAIPLHLQADVSSLFQWAHDQSPAEPFWYLSLIGVVPAERGRGVGTELLTQGLRRVDHDRCAAYLWSSNPRNIPFYRRFGFDVVTTSTFGASPPVTAMLRPAR